MAGDLPFFLGEWPGMISVCDVSTALPDVWGRLEAAWGAYEEALRAAVDASGFDEEQNRMRVRCPRWHGEVVPRGTWWDVVVASDRSGKSWPSRAAVSVMCADSAELAAARIAEHPDEFYVHAGGIGFALVSRGQLRVEQRGYGSIVSACFGCGWSRVEHGASRPDLAPAELGTRSTRAVVA